MLIQRPASGSSHQPPSAPRPVLSHGAALIRKRASGGVCAATQLIAATSAGVASTSYLSAEIFRQDAKINVVHIPYKGAPEATTAVIRNDAQLYFAPIPATQDLSASGKVKAIGINSAQRVPQLPQVPTIAETLPEYKYESWFGVLAPAGTPREIVSKVSADIAKVLRMEDVRDKLLAQGSIPAPTTPQEFDAINRADTERYGKILRDAGITPQ